MLELAHGESFEKNASVGATLAVLGALAAGSTGGFYAGKSIYEGRENDRQKLQDSVINPGTALTLLAAGAGAKHLYDKYQGGGSGEVTMGDLNSIMGRRR